MKLPYSIAVLWAALYSFFPSRSLAQSDRDTSFSNLINCIASCSMYAMEEYDSLYELKVKFGSTGLNRTYIGWIKQEDTNGQITLFASNHQEFLFSRSSVSARKAVSIDAGFIDTLLAREKKNLTAYFDLRFLRHYMLALWLYKKGYPAYAARLLEREDTPAVRSGFGIFYYDQMLYAFSDRNYPEAIRYGEHLLKPVFNDYKYHREIVELTRQLRARTEDFKTLCLPTPAVWDSLKQKRSRTQRVKYMADRLKLINCIQPGQPAGISYSMVQYSIPYSEHRALELSSWDSSGRYRVVNPYNELLAMKLKPAEVKFLMLYMSDSSYIPTYTYFRDFFAYRTLHTLNWVVFDLLSKAAHVAVPNDYDMDTMPEERKQELMEKIRKYAASGPALRKRRVQKS